MEKKKLNCWLRFTTKFDKSVQDKFTKWTAFVSRHPKKIITIMFILSIGLGIGFLNKKVENDLDKTYVPQDSVSMRDLDWWSDVWGSPPRYLYFLLETEPTGNNALVKGAFDILWEIDSFLRNLKVEFNGNQIGFEDVCIMNPITKACVEWGVFAYWNFNRTLMDIYNDYYGVVNGGIDIITGERLPYENALGGVERNNGNITFVKGIRTYYALSNAPEEKEKCLAFEKKILDWLADFDYSSSFAIGYTTGRSIDDEIGRSTGSTLGSVAIGYTIMLIVLGITLGKITSLLHSHFLMAPIGVLSVGLGIISAFGTGSYFITWCNICSILPFLILAVGVDNIYIIINNLDRISSILSPLERCQKALSRSTSILMTAIIDTLAFLSGTVTKFPAIKWFCAYGALCISIVFIFQMTMFLSFLTMEAKRIRKRKHCLFPCYRLKEKFWIDVDTEKESETEIEMIEKEKTTDNEFITEKEKTTDNEFKTEKEKTTDNEFQTDQEFQTEKETTESEQEFKKEIFKETESTNGVSLIDNNEFIDLDLEESSVPHHIRMQQQKAARKKKQREQKLKKQGKINEKDETQSTISKKSIDSGSTIIAEIEEEDYDVDFEDLPFLPRFIEKYYGPFITKKNIKILIVIIFTIMFGVSIYLSTHIREGLIRKDVFPDDSHLQDFYRIRERYFDPEGRDYYLVFETGTPYHTLYGKNAVLETASKINESKWLKHNIENWYLDYLLYLQAAYNGTSYLDENGLPQDPINFYVNLTNFFSQRQYMHYLLKQHVLINPNQSAPLDQKIIASRMPIYSIDLSDTQKDVESMLDLREITESSQVDCYMFYYFLFLTEQYVVIKQQTFQSIGLALVGLFVVTIIFLVHYRIAFIILITIAFIDIDLFAYMTLLHIRLDVVAYIVLVMSIGFSLDYSAHLSHYFVITPGRNNNKRVIKSLSVMGLSVFFGAFSTFLGVLPVLVFANSNFFRTFTKLFYGTILFAILHGLLFLPVLLSTFGPKYIDSHKRKK
ncbi:patched domain-containing protein [Anaeramoeba ignava]|uniref:Patched domain-containing protein n=1 Tax=Anaeramoeba ignava TaxID=1746090 RepID=A0A9Q0LED7_ANAIG|nr:patched domain-containing protein [Anaeramoeba ignava]